MATSAADIRISFEDFMPIYNSAKGSSVPGSKADFVSGLKVFEDKNAGGNITAVRCLHLKISYKIEMLAASMSNNTGTLTSDLSHACHPAVPSTSMS